MEKMHRKIKLVAAVMMVPILAFAQHTIGKELLRNGDLLFVGANVDKLSGAINRVTQRNSQQTYDHIGLLEKDANGNVYVLNASTRKGSAQEGLDSFYVAEGSGLRIIAVYRLRDSFQYTISNAIVQAHRLLGKPYNWSYILNDSSYYCSDFVERSFRKDTVFHLEPMTFINPKTGSIDNYWISFYKKQNLEVPQGQLGCNPNGLAASPKLYFVGLLRL